MADINILLVEDEQIVAKYIEKQLTGAGYKIMASVTSGEKAIEKVTTLKPDIVLMGRCLDNIKNLIKDVKFQKDLDDYAKKRLDQINSLVKKADEAVKTIITAKNFNELYVDVQEIGKDLTLAIDNVEKDYWNHIKDYITLYLHQEEKEEDDEGDGEQF